MDKSGSDTPFFSRAPSAIPRSLYSPSWRAANFGGRSQNLRDRTADSVYNREGSATQYIDIYKIPPLSHRLSGSIPRLRSDGTSATHGIDRLRAFHLLR